MSSEDFKRVWDGPSRTHPDVTVADRVADGFSSPERRIEQWAGIDWLPGEPGESVLDVACGDANHHDLFAAERKMIYSGCDFSERMLELARQHYPDADLFRADATDLDVPDDSYGYTFCRGLLLHMPREVYPSIVAELVRVAQRRAVLQMFAFLLPPGYDGRDRNGAIVRYDSLADCHALVAATGRPFELHVKRSLTLPPTEREQRRGIEAYFVIDAG